jgi:hypothetical protein
MTPFDIDPSWYEAYWYGERAVRKRRPLVRKLLRSAVPVVEAFFRRPVERRRRIAGARDLIERQSP